MKYCNQVKKCGQIHVLTTFVWQIALDPVSRRCSRHLFAFWPTSYPVKSAKLKYLSSLIMHFYEQEQGTGTSNKHTQHTFVFQMFFLWHQYFNVLFLKPWHWISACVSTVRVLPGVNLINGMGMSYIWQVMKGISGKWPFCEVTTKERKKKI